MTRHNRRGLAGAVSSDGKARSKKFRIKNDKGLANSSAARLQLAVRTAPEWFVGERHVEIVKQLPSDTSGIEWYEFEERPGKGPGLSAGTASLCSLWAPQWKIAPRMAYQRITPVDFTNPNKSSEAAIFERQTHPQRSDIIPLRRDSREIARAGQKGNSSCRIKFCRPES
jgi:hypothetical protein